MENLSKLVSALTTLANVTTELVRKKLGEPYQPELPLVEDTYAKPIGEVMSEVAEKMANLKLEGELVPGGVKVTRKKRLSRAKVQKDGLTAEIEEPKAEDQNPLEDLGITDTKEEDQTPTPMTDEESFEAMKTECHKYLMLNKNETPDGKTKLSALIQKQYKQEKLGALTHPQRVDLLGRLEKAISAKEAAKGKK